MPSYATKQNLYNKYGQVNIDLWADLDNDEVVESIEVRIAESIREASESYVDAWLAESRYPVPFSSPYPSLVVTLTTLQAGVLLYDAFQVIRSVRRDEVTHQRKQIKLILRGIKSSNLKILDPTTFEPLEQSSQSVPLVHNEVILPVWASPRRTC